MTDEATIVLLNGEPNGAWLILRDLTNALVEHLVAETKRSRKNLHRRLSERGNPSIDNLAAIFSAVR